MAHTLTEPKKRVFCKDCKFVKNSLLLFFVRGRYHNCTKLNSYNTQKGEKWSETFYVPCEEYEKIKKSLIGRKHTEESIAKMSGKNNHMYGKKHSEAAKKKMRIAAHNHKNQDNA